MFSFDGEDFMYIASTSEIHDGVKMTEYENEPFIIGDYKHNQVEFMHLSHERWYLASPFRYRNQIYGYAAVTRPGEVFILGGCGDLPSGMGADLMGAADWSQIILFENDEWSYFGRLKHGRINFMTVTYGTDVMIIGGRTFQNQT